MGCKSPVREPCSRSGTLAEVLAEGKGGIVRDRLKEAGVQSYEPTNRNGIQGQVSGEVSTLRLRSGCPEPAEWAQHDEAPGSGDRVNAARPRRMSRLFPILQARSARTPRQSKTSTADYGFPTVTFPRSILILSAAVFEIKRSIGCLLFLLKIFILP